MSLTLAELAIHIPASIELFEKYELDYYQNGKQPLSDACGQKGLSFDAIDKEISLLQSNQQDTHLLALEEMSIERLIDFINGQYHADEEEVLSLIQASIQLLLRDKSCGVMLEMLLEKVQQKFLRLADKLTLHCKNEDELLFPYLRKLIDLHKYKAPFSSVQSTLKSPVPILEAEHVEATVILSRIRRATNNFRIPANAHPQYVILIGYLKNFERNLHMHIHIENNILFPKLNALEEELKNRKN